MEEFARAKINLALHVTGQRNDGYHLLDTLITFAEVGDRLTFEPSQDLSLAIAGPEGAHLTAGDDNLVLRAASTLRDHVGDPSLGVRITLEKYLPVSSGIGGGSADAAAVLRGLVEFWQLEIDAKMLNEIAIGLGADVPMCLAGAPARVRGIGEIIEPVAVPRFAIVLVNPGVGVATPTVFRALENHMNTPMSPIRDGLNWLDYLANQRNDLEPPAMLIAPGIRNCLSTLAGLTSCTLARMSGSGATCFGLFESLEQADQAADTVRAEHPDWWVLSTSTLSG